MRYRWIASVCVALVVVFTANGAAQQATDGPEDPTFVACSTCAGTGKADQRCWVCTDGEHACPACGRFRAVYPKRWSETWVPQSLLDVLAERLAKATKDLNDLDASGLYFRNAARGKVPKPAKIKPGELRCPAKCRGGELLHVQHWTDCKLCRGGKFKCQQCKKGRVDCETCDGRGSFRRPCDDCAGARRIPDPTNVPVETCPWCLGEGTRACGTCDERGEAVVPCIGCLGRLQMPCKRCHGVEKVPCTQCGGRGRYGPQKKRCDLCDKKGFDACNECEDGIADCTTCGGRPGRLAACPDCSGARTHPCNGCGVGAYTAWEVTAAWFHARGDHARALEWVRAARWRCERRYAEGIAEVDDDELRSAAQDERKRELKRLDATAAKIAKDADER